jgi:hypothetical protein
LAVDTTPSTVVITHGDTLACERLALEIHELLPAARVIIPRAGAVYTVGHENP